MFLVQDICTSISQYSTADIVSTLLVHLPMNGTHSVDLKHNLNLNLYILVWANPSVQSFLEAVEGWM